ncbi:sulfotransferase [Skermanella rosea]|uniref:sulfotransferase family protein n=1 Tax=Skermanella rosea TaxID=1817965 RepID=UPI0019328F07|nr:sulfotransferase [Skermanella rosea]UEM05388.1 sulfotransferase [Skermanella rosea]
MAGTAPPRWFHPLVGADRATLRWALSANGPIAPERRAAVWATRIGATYRRPFVALEKRRVRRRLAEAPPMAPPVFIVGHWRSGTTHLYNVLSRSPQWGWVPPFAAALPWDFLGITGPIRTILEEHLPSDRLIDNIPVTPDSPQEDELPLALMTSVSYYHGLFFPSRFEEHFNRGIFFDGCTDEEIAQWRAAFGYFLDKVSLIRPGLPLLLKNPVHSARIPLLRAMWPEAKFIHIHRNPFVVYPSTRRTFATLLSSFALQDPSRVDLDRIVLDLYPRLMDRLLADAAALPETHYAEIRFEDFERQPIAELERVYRTLGLPGWPEAERHFQVYLDGIQGYAKNRHRYPPDEVDRVGRHWGALIDRWGYAPPAG